MDLTLKLLKSALVLITFSFIITSCGTTKQKLETENQQLKIENTAYQSQVDSLNQQIRKLVMTVEFQQKLSEKQSAIVARDLEPMKVDVTYAIID